MPTVIHWVTYVIPATYFVEILRGVVLRGAELHHVWPSVQGLAICCVVVIGIAIARFRKQLG